MNIYKIFTLLIFLLSIVIFNCSKSQPNYYKDVYLDGRYEIIGKNPINDDIANKTDCYHFVYNKKGKIIKVEHLLKGVLQNDTNYGISITLVENSEGYETRKFLTVKGKPIASIDGVYSIQLRLEENNNVIKTLFLDGL